MSKTKLCRKCKMEIPKGASKCPHCQSSQTSPIITILAIIIVVGALWLFFGNRNNSSSSSSSASQKTDFEKQMEEKGYIWGNKSLGLAISKDTKYTTSKTLTKITGVVYNASKTNYSYVQVVFAVYDENGMKVGDAWGNVAGLNSGESWKYEASYLGKCSEYKLTEVSAY